MGRESIFSDDRVIEALSRDFISVGLNNVHSQYREQDDALKGFVSQILDQSNYREINYPFDSAQGYYAFSADGKLYGYTNDSCAIESIRVREAGPVFDLIRRAKETHDKERPRRAALLKEDRRHDSAQTQPTPPKDAVVLAVYARVRPIPEGADERNKRIGRDYLWVLDGEVQQLLGGEFPMDLALRIARYHLVDDVRGLPGFWDPEHVRKASFHADVVKDDGKTCVVHLGGEFSMVAPAGHMEEKVKLPETGYEGSVEGEIVYDRTARRMQAFRVYAEGQAWGHWENTEFAPEGKFPLKVAMVLDEGTLARQIAPGAVSGFGVEDYVTPPRGE